MDPYMDLMWILYGSYMDPYMDPIWIQIWILYGDLVSSFLQFMLSLSYNMVIWPVASFNLEPSG